MSEEDVLITSQIGTPLCDWAYAELWSVLKIVFEECENKTSKNIFYLCVVINGLINSADQI